MAKRQNKVFIEKIVEIQLKLLRKNFDQLKKVAHFCVSINSHAFEIGKEHISLKKILQINA